MVQKLHHTSQYQNSEVIQQRQASVNKNDGDPAHIQIRLMRAEDVDFVQEWTAST